MEYVKDVFPTEVHDDGTISSTYMAELPWISSHFFTKKFKKMCERLDVSCEVSVVKSFMMRNIYFDIKGTLDNMVMLQRQLKRMTS